MLAPGRDCSFHIGAHKTASSHLQIVLKAKAAGMRERGVAVLFALHVLQQLMGFRGGALARMRQALRSAFRGDRRLAALRAVVEREATGCKRVVISEECIPGLVSHALENPLYPRLSDNLSLFRALARGGRSAISLSIRSLDGFLPSAYAGALKFDRGAQSAIRAVMARPDPARWRWSDMVARIARVWSETKIRVWSYDDYARRSTDIIAAITGETLPTPSAGAPRRTMTPSAHAVALAEAPPTPPAPERLRCVLDIYAQHPAGPDAPKYNPFDDATRGRLRAAFHEDLAAVERDGRACLMRFQ